MDQFFLNLAVYRMEELFATLAPPPRATFVHGRPLETHGWWPLSQGDLVREMAEHIAAEAPPDEPPARWLY